MINVYKKGKNIMKYILVLLVLLNMSSAHAWMNYPVVDTAQTLFYDTNTVITPPASGEPYYGQDAQFTRYAPNYTDNGDGTVSDNVTDLMWTQSPDTNGDGDIDVDDKMLFSQAPAYAESLNTAQFAGYDDWRVPSIKELYSLMDFRGTDPPPEGLDTTGLIPFIDTNYFDFAYGDTASGDRIIDVQYVTDTLYVDRVMNGQTAMFGLNLADGRIKGYSTSTKTYLVLCVRGTTNYGVNDFFDNSDGTISDRATGLMWAQNDNGDGIDWRNALAWVQQQNALNYCGYNDWRLPNAKELQSIVDYTRAPGTDGTPAIDPLFNTTTITNEAGDIDFPFFWSGTTHVSAHAATAGSRAVYVAFGRGLGSMDGTTVIDVHGAGCQRSDPKTGDPADFPSWGHGPQGDVQRVFNYVRLVRDDSVPEPGMAMGFIGLFGLLLRYTK